MKLVKVWPNKPELADMYKFYCPACREHHIVSVGPKAYWKQQWEFNGDFNKPTINPSILVTRNMPDGEHRCHSFIRDGKMQYLNDCTHEMKGQTVELPDIDEKQS